MTVVDTNLLSVTSLDDSRVVCRSRDDVGVSRLGRVNLLVILNDEHRIRRVRLATLRGNRYWNLGVVAGLSVGRWSSRDVTVFVHGGGPSRRELTDFVNVTLGVILHGLACGLAWLGERRPVERTVDLNWDFLRGCHSLARLLRAHADLAWLRILSDLLGRFRIAYGLAILQLPNLRDFLLAECTGLILYDLSSLEVRVSLDEGLIRSLLGVLIGQFSLRWCGTDLDDLLSRLADLLGVILGGNLTVVGGHRNGVLDLTWLAFLDNIRLTSLEVRILANLHLKRGAFGPLDGLGRGRALCADLDDLLDRLCNALSFGLGTDNLRVHDVLGRGDLILTRLAFLDSLLGTSIHRVVELNLGLERHSNLRLGDIRTHSLSADANNLLLWFLGALSSHGWLAGRLAIHNLLSGGHDIDTGLALLFDDLLAFLQGVVKDNLRLERNRLLGLGHHGGVLSSRAVLDDLVDRILGLLLLRFNRGVVALGREVRGVGLLTRHTLLDNLDLARLQLRVRTGLNFERNLSGPGDLLRCLGRLGADLNDLVHRRFGDLLLHGGFAIRLGVGDLLGNGNRLLARLTLGDSLRRTSRHVRVKLDLYAERNLRLHRLSGLTSSLATNADNLLDRSLSLLLGDYRITGRFTVDKLLLSRNGLFAFFTLLLDDLLASLKGVVIDDLSLERNAVLLGEDQFLILKARAILHDAWLRVLGHGIGRGLHRRNATRFERGVELRSNRALASFTLLNDLYFTRLERRVRTHDGVETSSHGPGHLIGSLCRLGTNDDDLIDRSLGLLPIALDILRLCTWNAFGFDLVGALRDGVIELVINVERHLASRGILNVDRCINPIGRTIGVGNRNRNLDRVTRLRGLRCSSNNVAPVVQAHEPVTVCRRDRVCRVAEAVGLTGCRIAISGSDLVWLILRHGNTFRQLNGERRSNSLARERGLRRVGRIDLKVLSQIHHGGNRSLIG